MYTVNSLIQRPNDVRKLPGKCTVLNYAKNIISELYNFAL